MGNRNSKVGRMTDRKQSSSADKEIYGGNIEKAKSFGPGGPGRQRRIFSLRFILSESERPPTRFDVSLAKLSDRFHFRHYAFKHTDFLLHTVDYRSNFFQLISCWSEMLLSPVYTNFQRDVKKYCESEVFFI